MKYSEMYFCVFPSGTDASSPLDCADWSQRAQNQSSKTKELIPHWKRQVELLVPQECVTYVTAY